MNTRQLFYLVTIADSGSLSEAARLLGISQPALSRFLRECEDRLGVPLFLRSRRRLSLTGAGRQVLLYARSILEEQARMLRGIRSASGGGRRQLRLATAPNRGAVIYSKVCQSFSRRYPDISLSLKELYAAGQPEAVRLGQVDLSIGAGEASSLVAELPFAREEVLAALPVSHPLAACGRISLLQLQDTPLILPGPRHSIRSLADQLFREAGLTPLIFFESDDVILLDSMLRQASCASLVSRPYAAPCRELVYRPLDPPVYQTLRIRFPLGHTMTEPEQFLAGLMIRQKIQDPRYEAICSDAVTALSQLAEQMEQEASLSPRSALLPPPAAGCRQPLLSLQPQHLAYISAIAEKHGLSQAAEAYYLTQPALSRCLRSLEETLGVSLFSRAHNRLRPTAAGTLFLSCARRILQLEEEMEESLSQYRQERSGSLRLYCEPSLAERLNTVLLPALQSVHPEGSLQIITGNAAGAEHALQNASADYALYFSRESRHPILKTELLYQSELIYCGSSASALLLARPGSSLRSEQDRLLRESPEKAGPAIVCEAEPSILALLAGQNAGSTILPKELLPSSALTRCCRLPHRPQLYLMLAHHPGLHLPPAARELAKLLRAQLKAAPAALLTPPPAPEP